jgi:hypothetical protein
MEKLSSILNDPHSLQNPGLDDLIISIFESSFASRHERLHQQVYQLARKVMIAWLKRGGFLISESQDGLSRKARIVSFLQGSYDHIANRSTGVEDQGTCNDLCQPCSKRRRISDVPAGSSLDESTVKIFNDIALQKIFDSSKLFDSLPPTAQPSISRTIVIPETTTVAKMFNEGSFLEACRNLSAKIKRPDQQRSTTVFAAAICDLLVNLLDAPASSWQTYLAAADLMKISDDLIPSISDELVKKSEARKLVCVFIAGVLLPKIRSSSSPASRALAKGIDILYRYDHQLVMSCLLRRLLCDHGSSSSTTGCWKPSHTHMELVMRMIRQTILSAHDKEMFMSSMLYDQAYEYGIGEGRDEVNKLVELLDGDKDMIVLRWTVEHAKIFQLLCPAVCLTLSSLCSHVSSPHIILIGCEAYERDYVCTRALSSQFDHADVRSSSIYSTISTADGDIYQSDRGNVSY